MARPPDDFNNEPTRYRDIGRGNQPPPLDQPGPPPAPDELGPQPPDPFDAETEPTAWYRRPVVLLGWGLMVLILIGLIIFGIIELVADQGETSTPKTTTTTPQPTTSTTSMTTATTTPPTTSTTATTATTATTTTAAPTTSSVVQPPAQQPTQQPTHRHHWPSWLPTTLPALP